MIAYESLPSRVVLPPEEIFEGHFHANYWRYVRGTLERLAGRIEIEYSRDLRRPDWSAFEVLVDNELIAIDFSDFALISPASSAYSYWFRFHHTNSLEPFPNFGSFPPWSFLDWAQYDSLLARAEYKATGSAVVYRHGSLEDRLSGVVRRRSMVREILERDFPDRLETGFLPQENFFDVCLASALIVHVPGSHPHILDRTVQQMFAAGVCVVSPDLWTTCLEQRPVPDEHYLLVRDDFSNLSDVVRGALADRDRCAAIGNAARRFFKDHCTPEAIWSYVQRKITARLIQPPARSNATANT